MHLESEEPSKGTLVALGYAFECLVDVYPLVSAPQRCAVYEAEACVFVQESAVLLIVCMLMGKQESRPRFAYVASRSRDFYVCTFWGNFIAS